MKTNLVKGSVISLIPARGGSKGVPGKNIRKINGFPLIAYTIAISLMSQKIHRTIVTTDSEEIAEIAIKFGAEVPFLRPSELAGDKSEDIEFVRHAINWFSEHEDNIPEYIVHLRPTTPLREVKILDQAINQIMLAQDATSLRSGHIAPESPYKWFIKNESGFFQSIIPGMTNEKANSGRQNFPNVYIPDGYADIIKTQFVLDNDILHGDKMMGFESPPCIEVDTEEEFSLLEYKFKQERNSISEFLLRNYSQWQEK